MYVVGDWFAVVADGGVGLLPAGARVDLVHELWASLCRGAQLADQLQVLLGGGIGSLPPFALVSVEGRSVRVAVRGEVEVTVATAAGPRVVSAPNVSTWSEEVVADATSVTVRTPGWDGAVSGALPIGSGIVRTGGLFLELSVGVLATPVERVVQAEPVPVPVLELAPVLVAVPAPVKVHVPEPVHVPAPVPEPEPVHVPEPELAPVPEPVPEPEPVLVPLLQPDSLLAVEPAPLLAVVPRPMDPPVLAPVAPLVSVSAAAAPSASAPLTGAVDRAAPEDHDGMTVLSSDVVALRRQMPAWVGDAMPGPLVVPVSHASPPARLQLSTGIVVTLDRPVLIGRAPQVSRVANSEIPRLVTVASPNQDISRTHAEVRMDRDDVVVTDLHSTNGVILHVDGRSPRRLHPGEPAVVDPGVMVDLGEGITFTVERGA
ncbi:FHA domain-containing protein [Pengzhenrongella phosphoraccumulans]|uniref:FHA domain-containing protein n=1 Tax=Pengzhenrongella phosphoraccumulans TaxID=3114394 RepID=UPI0038905F28